MRERYEDILKAYDQRILAQHFTGPLRDQLREGLEGILIETDKQETSEGGREINYDAISNLANQVGVARITVTKLCSRLTTHSIVTTGDVLRLFADHLPTSTSEGIRVAPLLNAGSRISRLLYTYLNSIDVQVFTDGYRETEIAKSTGESTT